MPDYAIDRSKLSKVPLHLPLEYLVFVHNTSWETKEWPENYWSKLINNVASLGYQILLPWGSARERERAERLAVQAKNVLVLPKLSLLQIASVLANAKAAVCVDTGLSHLTAALNVSAVTLYGPTNPDLIGAVGKSQTLIRADFPCAPCKQMKCSYKKPSKEKPACFVGITPERVWTQLQKII
jgi:heptosyltransferase-1